MAVPMSHCFILVKRTSTSKANVWASILLGKLSLKTKGLMAGRDIWHEAEKSQVMVLAWSAVKSDATNPLLVMVWVLWKHPHTRCWCGAMVHGVSSNFDNISAVPRLMLEVHRKLRDSQNSTQCRTRNKVTAYWTVYSVSTSTSTVTMWHLSVKLWSAVRQFLVAMVAILLTIITLVCAVKISLLKKPLNVFERGRDESKKCTSAIL